MFKPKLASKYNCTGCMACVDACAHSVLHGYIAKDGHLYVACDSGKCVQCGRCSLVCPVINNFNYEAQDRASEPYVGWANDKDLRSKSASGGIFAALANYVISNGGIVVGAAMEKMEVKHLFVDNINELYKIQGSKYQQGNLSGIYKQVKSLLKEGKRILFSGTPCQVGGLYSYLSPYRYEGQLITLDLICGGFPSLLPLHTLIRNVTPTIAGIKSFRDKEHGWKSSGYEYRLVGFYENGEIADLGSRNIVLGAFGSYLTNRYSCYNCHFAYAKRKSDITIADFWGEKRFPNEHYEGVSVIVVHSKNGMGILNKSNVTYEATLWADFLHNNPRMIYAQTKYLKYHPSRMFMTFLFKRCSYSFLSQLYNGSKRSFWLLPYAGYGYLLCQLNSFKKKRAIKRGIKLYDK